MAEKGIIFSLSDATISYTKYVQLRAKDCDVIVNTWTIGVKASRYWVQILVPTFRVNTAAASATITTATSVSFSYLPTSTPTPHLHYMGYSFRLATMIILYTPFHRQDSTYHILCYTSRWPLAGRRTSSVCPPWRIDPTTYRTRQTLGCHHTRYIFLLFLIRPWYTTTTSWVTVTVYEGGCDTRRNVFRTDTWAFEQECPNGWILEMFSLSLSLVGSE